MIFYNLSISDPITKNPIYTQLNFDYYSYNKDFNLNLNTKYDIFTNFWNRNNFDYRNAFKIKDDLVKYFLPITYEIIDYLNEYGFLHNHYLSTNKPITYIPDNKLMLNQFDLIHYTDEEVRRLQDYYYYDNSTIYSKYNFNFNSYSEDFNPFPEQI